MHFHRPNVVICNVITGKCNLSIRAYLSPSTLEHLPDLLEALTCFHDQYPILLGGLNNNIQSENPCSQQVSELLVEFRLVYLCHHIGSAGGSDTCNMVLDVTRHIFADKM